MEIRVRPIHNEADYERTLSEVEALMDAEPGTPRGERLDVLVTLVEAYEARHWPIGNPDPIDAIRLRMKQKNLRQRDLVPMIGSRGRVSEILARKRSLTLPMIRRLARELDIRPDVLIQETPLTRPRRAEAGRRGESTRRSD
jgi:HTH-type transcriptional regulator / antitoxin HigA